MLPFVRAIAVVAIVVAVLSPLGSRAVRAAPDAAFVMDARTGEVLKAENADTPLHPASLTKMMTLYLAFYAIERGVISPGDQVRVSAHAAKTSGATLGLVPGQVITVADLIKATAIGSANDAAVALAESVAGSEMAFVSQMNAAAAAMGLTRTRFQNAHGLTAEGHLSTARDMSVLGRRLLWDFPSYRWLYSRSMTEIGQTRLAHTNRRFLGAYKGASGIKTGYTRAAGFTLTASAARGSKHLIVTILGAPSSSVRAERASDLLNWGFAQVRPDSGARAPPPLDLVAVRDPAPVPPEAPPALLVAARPLFDEWGPSGRPDTDGPGQSGAGALGGVSLNGLGQAWRPSSPASTARSSGPDAP